MGKWPEKHDIGYIFRRRNYSIERFLFLLARIPYSSKHALPSKVGKAIFEKYLGRILSCPNSAFVIVKVSKH